MNLLVVGISHRTADVALLEKLALRAGELPDVLAKLLAQPYVREALVVSTCNRVEVYAVVGSFHGGLSDVGTVLAERAGVSVTDLAGRLYAHYGVEAVRHAYRVAAGLDSMVVGESQILGQFRDSYSTAAELSATGRLLHELAQQALRVGKRVHAETGIDRAGQSVVSAALELGLTESGLESVSGRQALVIGAGAMGALSLATLHRSGAGGLLVTNRSAAKAVALAGAYNAIAAPMADIPDLLRTVDVVVCATASPGTVLEAVPGRTAPLLVLDLAVPHDVHPGVADHPAVTLVTIERLRAAGSHVSVDDVTAAEDIVAAEVDAFTAWHRGSDVAPTVAALRARAEDVVSTELRRLAGKRPEFDDDQRAEIARTLHRVVQRLLHEPTVRVRQRASEPGGEAYASVLRELFDLPAPTPVDVPGALDFDHRGEL
ncbi:glutamyl-tRNA reductase [Virgisporangium aliadipatigenens]|uniref:Glutamyl-tRNA reductase n=1 Tax=Virgisporangium aliadipatigenens TaxID=741659 RepID=A0A8J4DSW2_9ACTN|nr:glutamyl-tRNA reductase [Virgisporangium aliadipatigenens]GIJ48566.1 glutamyl-tRNA reductase [Virgisporangium aliadipatigenens]